MKYCESLDARLPVYEDSKFIENFKSENIVQGIKLDSSFYFIVSLWPWFLSKQKSKIYREFTITEHLLTIVKTEGFKNCY